MGGKVQDRLPKQQEDDRRADQRLHQDDESPGEFPESLFEAFTADDFNRVRLYIEEKMTATYVPETGNAPSGDVVTAELIYYWMIALGVPFECQHWNLDRLLTLIKVCNLKNDPKNAKKKTTTSDAIAQRRAINERRRRQLGSSG
jgi:hypothetical protein